VARLGGDEFAILAPAVDKEQLEVLARRVLIAACQSVKFGDHEIPVATSIGLAMFPECGESPQQLLQAADLAMYEAKRSDSGGLPIRTATSAPSGLPLGRPSARLAR
jgi:diguanylate cyclase (GGDEF)-like protein